jgi:MIP family channel proteins
MDNKLLRSLIAEFVGTFTLVFVGVGAAAVAGTQGVVVAALGHGLVLVGLIYAYGHISGAHFNPAVTLGLLVGGKIEVTAAGLYMVAQFAGAIVAGFLAVALSVEGGQTTGSLTASAVGTAAIFEAVLTFFLVSAIYQAAVYGKAGGLAPVAIGLTLAGCILAGGVYTGASLNPARTVGPALAGGGDLSYVAPYLVGLFAGGALAGLFHSFVLKSE